MTAAFFDGLGLPEVQMHDTARMFKLAALAIGAAVRTIQLVDARDGGGRAAMSPTAIGPTLEGKTPRPQNPHPLGSLPWLAGSPLIDNRKNM
jgi:hypothetical protein